VERYQQHKPDLVMTGLTLEGETDGLYVISAIRAADPDARVMLCGREEEMGETVMAQAAGRGCCGFYSLPADDADYKTLLSAVKRSISRRRVPVEGMGNLAIVAGRVFFMKKVLQDMLRKAGCNPVAEAETGEACIALYRQIKPALVLVGEDLLGELDVLDVIRTICSENPRAKVLVYSSQPFSETALRGIFQAGACDCMEMPFQQEQLFAKIKAHCAWTME